MGYKISLILGLVQVSRDNSSLQVAPVFHPMQKSNKNAIFRKRKEEKVWKHLTRYQKEKAGNNIILPVLHNLDAWQHGPFFLCLWTNQQQQGPLNVFLQGSSYTYSIWCTRLVYQALRFKMCMLKENRNKTIREPLICHNKNACCELGSCSHQKFASNHGHYHGHHDVNYLRNKISQLVHLVLLQKLHREKDCEYITTAIK